MKALPWGLFVYFMASGHVNRTNRPIGYSVVQIRTDLLGNLVIQTTPPKMKEASRRSVARLLDA